MLIQTGVLVQWSALDLFHITSSILVYSKGCLTGDLMKATIPVVVCGKFLTALVYSGSSKSYIDSSICSTLISTSYPSTTSGEQRNSKATPPQIGSHEYQINHHPNAKKHCKQFAELA